MTAIARSGIVARNRDAILRRIATGEHLHRIAAPFECSKVNLHLGMRADAAYQTMMLRGMLRRVRKDARADLTSLVRFDDDHHAPLQRALALRGGDLIGERIMGPCPTCGHRTFAPLVGRLDCDACGVHLRAEDVIGELVRLYMPVIRARVALEQQRRREARARKRATRGESVIKSNSADLSADKPSESLSDARHSAESVGQDGASSPETPE